jgi:hypothetical protein
MPPFIAAREEEERIELVENVFFNSITFGEADIVAQVPISFMSHMTLAA